MSAKKRKGSKLAWILLVLFLVLLIGGSINYLRPLPKVTAISSNLNTSPGSANIAWPSDGSSAAVGAVGYGILDSSGSGQYPTASIAKLITVLSVLNKYPLQPGQTGPTITFTGNDVAIYNSYVAEDGSVVQVTAGEQMSEYQAIQAMLLPSANNIADSLAIWAFGSLGNYKTYATTELQNWGLNSTVIGDDASGYLPSTESTPTDLVSLGTLALSNPVVAQIVAQSSATLPIAGTVTNVNSLLGQDGINGIKTGNSDQAGGCYLFSAPENIGGHSITVVGAVMHAPNLSAALDDAKPLLTSTADSFSLQTPVHQDQKIGTFTAAWGASANIVAANQLSLVAWDGNPLTSKLKISQLKGAEPAGTKVGSITLSSGNYKTSVNLVIEHSLNPPSIFWRLRRF